eukprot:1088781-Rhodomonas_salina.1
MDRKQGEGSDGYLVGITALFAEHDEGVCVCLFGIVRESGVHATTWKNSGYGIYRERNESGWDTKVNNLERTEKRRKIDGR